MKNSIWIFSILFLVFPLVAWPQKGVIRGKVVDVRTNEPLPFTNIVIYGSQIGSTSDLDGNFSFFGIEPGFTRLAASQVGYEPVITNDFLVTNAQAVFIEIPMNPVAINLEKVEIKASPFQRREESPLSMRSLDISEIEKNPGGNRDISRVIQSLPGVASSVSFRNDVIVRGGGSAENRFYLDGIEIPNLNHFSTQGASGGPVGIINVDFIREVDFYSGAFPANRGNALSSVLEMRQIEPNRDRFKIRTAVGASDLAFSANGPLSQRTSVLFSVRRSYLQFLFSAIGLPFLPTYNDYQLKVKTRINEKNELTVISIGALDQFRLNTGIENPNDDQRYILGYLPVNEQWNYAIGAVWKHFRPKGFDTWILSRNMLRNTAYKYAGNDESRPENLLQDYTSDEIENKFRFERYYLNEGWKVIWGTGAEHSKYFNSSFQKVFTGGSATTINYSSSFDMFRGSVFGQASRPFVEGRLTLSLGLRTDFNDYSSSMSNPLNQLSPRFSASWVLAPGWNLNFNTGRYFQLPAYTTLGFRDNAGAWVNKENNLKYMGVNHLVGGVEWAPDDNARVTVEGFFKDYFNYPLSVSDSIALASKGADFGVVGDEEVTSTAKGRSYGFEVMARSKDLKKFNIIMSYTFVRSEFQRNGEEYTPSAWDNRHIFNITIGRKFKGNWDVGAKWRFVGGGPYTPYDLELSSIKEAWDARNRGYLDYSRFNSLRFTDFHQLDLRIDKSWFFNRWTLIAYLDIQNFYNFKAQQPDLLTNLDPDGVAQTDPNDPERYLLRAIPNTAGQTLPTIGIIIEI
mgnify:CR=1 FL=1